MDELVIMRTKVLVPGWRANILTRQRLLDLCTALLDHKLIILSAPAGYGKTTLLIDLAHHVDLPMCWYALDALDADPHQFVTYFIEAIAHQFPNFGKQSRAALASMRGDIEWQRLVPVIVNEAYEHIRQTFILVLDDYHFVGENREIEKFIDQFVQYTDENCHVVLSSRTIPTLPELPLLVARSKVGGLDASALAFRSSEIQALILQNHNLTLTEQEARVLVQETEGWITGLLLSAQTMASGLAERLRVARTSGVDLYSYLAQQILEQQPPALRTFLLHTSLLKEFDAKLCQAVLHGLEPHAERNWQALIDHALQRNLFIQPIDSAGRWVRFHHLFQEFLESQLLEEDPETASAIQRRLGSVYAERGEWEKAYQSFQRLGDAEAIADLTEQAGLTLLYSARHATLARWIDGLPSEIVHSRPNLLSLRGTVAADRGEMGQALLLLNQAEAKSRRAGDLFCLAYTLVRRAGAQRLSGNYDASLEDAGQALSVIEQVEGDERLQTVRGAALRAKGLALYRLSRLEEAVIVLEQAKTSYQSLNNVTTVALVDNDLGMAYRASGAYQEARNAYLSALDCWRAQDNLMLQATALNNLGVLYHHMGDYEQAALSLEEAVVSARKSGDSRVEAFALTGLGDLSSDIEAYSAAQTAYHQARIIANRIDSGFLRYYLTVAKARLSRLQGDMRQARAVLDSAARSLEIGNDYWAALYHLEAGRLALAAKELEEAQHQLACAGRQLEAAGYPIESASAYLLLAESWHLAENERAATEALIDTFRLASEPERRQFLISAAREARSLLKSTQTDATAGHEVRKLQNQVNQFEAELAPIRRRLRAQLTVIPFSPPQLMIRALGQMEVEMRGRVITRSEWQSPKATELFFLLLAHSRGLTREEIGVILWPDYSPDKLKTNFDKTIYRLRRALDQSVILFDEGTERYTFNRAFDYHYDVAAFESRLQEAETATQQEQLSTYPAALDLYEGSYLPKIDGSWAWPIRERLDRSYRAAALRLAKLYLKERQYEKTVQTCRRLLADDPCLEEAHRLIMRAYAAKGNRGAIARQYQECEQALQRELDLLPSPHTLALYDRLISR